MLFFFKQKTAYEIAKSAVETTSHSAFIDGAWVETGGVFQVRDPATGDTICSVADSGPDEGECALATAGQAQSAWASTAPRSRAEILLRAFDMIVADEDAYAHLIALEMGKPVASARGEVRYGAEFLRWYSEEASRIQGSILTAPSGTGRIMTVRQPVGPTVLITPWNFPLAMGTRKIGAALAAGCTVVIKPAAETPLTLLRLAQTFADAGLPTGVLNVLPTSRASALIEPMLIDPRVRKLSFTGSTEVGRLLIAQSAQRVLRTSMELGGNAPLIVFDDADLDVAVEGAMVAKMRNMGESCVAANRIHVQRGIYPEFVAAFADRMSQLVVGPGLDPASEVGPMINRQACDSIQARVEDGLRRGAKVILGGEPMEGPGFFYPPTVMSDVPPDARLMREETFGPVAPIAVFDTEDQALRAAEATEFGLISYVFTRDFDRAIRVSSRIETGMVGINRGVVSDPAAPFGGVKASGLGREGGAEGIGEFLETKYIAF